MNIENINKRHYIDTDMFYRIGYGLTSKLLSYDNGIFHLEIVIGDKWDKSYNATASEIAHCWKSNYLELHHAIGCKAFIVDTKTHPQKQYLLQKGLRPPYDARKGILFAKYLGN